MKISDEMKKDYDNNMVAVIDSYLPKVEALENMLKYAHEYIVHTLDCEVCIHAYTYNDDMQTGCDINLNSCPSKCKQFMYSYEDPFYDFLTKAKELL